MDGNICRGGSSATLVTVIVVLIVLLWAQHSVAEETPANIRSAPAIVESKLLPTGNAITQGIIKINYSPPVVFLSMLRHQDYPSEDQNEILKHKIAQRRQNSMTQWYE
ncbi:MAG: hypothetical protein ACOY3I_03270 [Verrucomicrobiota bacterium]